VKKTIRKYSCMRRLDFSVFARPAWSLHRLELCHHPWHQVTSDTLTGQENRHGAFTDIYDIEAAHREITEFFSRSSQAGVTTLAAGGDHSITLAIFPALASIGPLVLIQIDAHTDTRDESLGSKYNHGTPFRRAVEENLLDPHRTVQVGIRGPQNGTDGWDYSRDSGMRFIFMEEFTRLGVERVVAEAREILGDGPTYISFDIDSLDPAFAPGTGTPEVGGLTTIEALELVRGLRGLNLIGADVVEVSPAYDPSGNTALVGATLMYELVCLLAESRSSAWQHRHLDQHLNKLRRSNLQATQTKTLPR
jgi:guanidinopropionase